jgi:hypothetical protein
VWMRVVVGGMMRVSDEQHLGGDVIGEEAV